MLDWSITPLGAPGLRADDVVPSTVDLGLRRFDEGNTNLFLIDAKRRELYRPLVHRNISRRCLCTPIWRAQRSLRIGQTAVLQVGFPELPPDVTAVDVDVATRPGVRGRAGDPDRSGADGHGTDRPEPAAGRSARPRRPAGCSATPSYRGQRFRIEIARVVAREHVTSLQWVITSLSAGTGLEEADGLPFADPSLPITYNRIAASGPQAGDRRCRAPRESGLQRPDLRPDHGVSVQRPADLGQVAARGGSRRHGDHQLPGAPGGRRGGHGPAPRRRGPADPRGPRTPGCSGPARRWSGRWRSGRSGNRRAAGRRTRGRRCCRTARNWSTTSRSATGSCAGIAAPRPGCRKSVPRQTRPARNPCPRSVTISRGGSEATPVQRSTSSAWLPRVASIGKMGSRSPASMISARGAMRAAMSTISNQLSRSGTLLQMQCGTEPRLAPKSGKVRPHDRRRDSIVERGGHHGDRTAARATHERHPLGIDPGQRNHRSCGGQCVGDPAAEDRVAGQQIPSVASTWQELLGRPAGYRFGRTSPPELRSSGQRTVKPASASLSANPRWYSSASSIRASIPRP